MKRPSLSPLIGAVLLVLFIILMPEKWLLPLLTDEKIEKAAVGLQPTMFEGVIMQEKMFKNPQYLPIFGSSELSRMDEFHPSNYFSVNHEGFTPFLVGRGGTESMYHFLNFAVHEKELKNKRIVFILSPQWFTQKGEDEKHFASNFSVIKAYEFALHPIVSENLLKKGSARMLSYQVVKNDLLLSDLLKANLQPNNKRTMKLKVEETIARGYLHLMERRDLLISIIGIQTKENHPKPHLIKGKSWGELDKDAEHIGKERATDNPFYIKNSYYNTMIKAKVKSLKGYRKGESFGVSPQYDDFQMILDVLKESGAKPLFVSVPVNGYWYDYTAFPEKGREVYYKKIKEKIGKEGFPVLDLSKHEYDKYFMTDTIHLGYKGWIQIDKGIEKFMNEKAAVQ